MSVQKMMPAFPGEKLSLVIIWKMWPPAAPHKKNVGQSTVAVLNPKFLTEIHINPITANPKLAKPTSN